ncbi:ubiquinol-cytochrome c reductase complex assembly factor 5 isoform X1 [Pseudophryne corroboree]|uniref:ubiquinol-cytochrome c reductase complex assembly factor 5 isoform X1 n=2 Tax=Pseudophryne corroboree TaxID=495146 RepID=UPI003081AE7B
MFVLAEFSAAGWERYLAMDRRSTIATLLDKVPGKKRFGMYRFLPFFFILGGAMEWFMINVRIGRETFYDVYRRRQSERMYEERANLEPKSQS